MEFRPHKSKMYVIWKNDKIYCNTESTWTDNYWKRTNGYRFKMTDTQNVLFWLNLKFSTYIFLKPKYFTQFPYFYVFRNLFAFILNLFFYGSDRYSFEKMNSRVFFYKLSANNFKLLHSRKYLFFYTYVYSHLLKNHSFSVVERTPCEFFQKSQKMNISWKKYSFVIDHKQSHEFSMKFLNIPNICLVRNYQLFLFFCGN